MTATEDLQWRGGEAGQQVPWLGRRNSRSGRGLWLRENPEPSGPWDGLEGVARVGLGFTPLIFPSGPSWVSSSLWCAQVKHEAVPQDKWYMGRGRPAGKVMMSDM